MKRWAIVAGLIVCSLTGTGTVRGQGQSDRAADLGGYYEYKTWETRVDGNQFKTKYRVRLVILNARGDRYNGLVVHTDRYHRVKGLKIRVFDRDGKLAYDRNQKDMTKVCGFGPSFSLYHDVCNYYIELSGPGYPYTIEYEYETEVRTLFFFDGDRFQEWLPVKSAVYELYWPADRELHYRVYDMEVTPSKIDHGKTVQYRWEASSLPAISDEPRVPPRYRMPGRVEFSPDEFDFDGFTFDDWSWNGVGRWYNALAADRYLPGVGTGQSPPADPMGAIREAYRHVVDADRYVSVSIGIGGWQPHEAASVEEKAYGDCKDLSTLLISYLREKGVEAYPALVLTRDNGVIDRDFPMFRFNHVITAAMTPTDTVWMDPTCNICPLGELPSSDEDIDVLLMNDGGGMVTRTPGSAAGDNRLERQTHIVLQRDQTFRADSRWLAAGNRALLLRRVFDRSDREAQRNFVMDLLPENGRGARLIDFGLESEDSVTGSVVLRVHFETTRPLDVINGTWYLHPDLFGERFGLPTISLKDRTVPVDLGYPGSSSDEILITWAGCPVFSGIVGPKDDSADCGVMSCRQAVTMYADSARIRIDRRAAAYELPVEAFDQLADLREVADRLHREVMKFRITSGDAKN